VKDLAHTAPWGGGGRGGRGGAPPPPNLVFGAEKSNTLEKRVWAFPGFPPPAAKDVRAVIAAYEKLRVVQWCHHDLRIETVVMEQAVCHQPGGKYLLAIRKAAVGRLNHRLSNLVARGRLRGIRLFCVPKIVCLGKLVQ